MLIILIRLILNLIKITLYYMLNLDYLYLLLYTKILLCLKYLNIIPGFNKQIMIL